MKPWVELMHPIPPGRIFSIIRKKNRHFQFYKFPLGKGKRTSIVCCREIKAILARKILFSPPFLAFGSRSTTPILKTKQNKTKTIAIATPSLPPAPPLKSHVKVLPCLTLATGDLFSLSIICHFYSVLNGIIQHR